MKQNMNPFGFPASANLILVAAVVIAGAVFRKESPELGRWITAAGLAYYLILNLLPAAKAACRFRALEPRSKAHVLIVAALLFLFVKAVFQPDILYFVILVLLAVEYLLADPPKA